ncbi:MULTISPECIES: hypothetical protein [unclassified Cyanobium]|uniref:hypothetical protein n=1 Tax=unclassified Cyanobium TaxID=2627006 RepID=UPI0020CB7A1E|nr:MULTISPECIES: hypothetical protein [unclassified Cyanobium]MCP9861239.1 hypothetical protein [Cyanobium sp. Cruz-8H5]MCP9868487.1 hypothetical protein [Cyanobium sp. Cruz-8D1]
MHSSIHRLAAGAAATAIGVTATPGLAAVYQALCTGGSECTVTLANGQIGTPGMVIQKEQVLSWSQGGSGSKTDVGMGVAGVVLFGIPGLIGFAAKKHDYTFSISYIDEAGNIQATSVGFKNNVPANQFMMELMGMTGLSVGEVNKNLQGRIDQIKAETAEKARIAALDCARILKSYGCSWDAYLAANPAVQIWAGKYPALVAAEKTRLGAID